MRKIIVCEYVSLDGVLQDPGESEDDTSGPPWWVSMYSDPSASVSVSSALERPFDLLLGRRTFELWAKFWPQHNAMWPAVNSATKYVASNTITFHEWRPSVFLNGDVAEKIATLTQTEGPDLCVCGSPNLVQTLLKHDLVDAFNLITFPVTLGGDKRLFADGTITAAFTVTESAVASNGVIYVNYERARDVPTGRQ